MSEEHNQSFQLSFNASLKVAFQGSRVTSDGGLILVRELDESLGFAELIDRHYWLLLPESHLTRWLFGAMVRRIAALPLPGGYGAAARKKAGRTEEGKRRGA